MFWNHRVMRRVYPKAAKSDSIQFGIYEVYYEKKKVWQWTEDPISVRGDTLKDLEENYRQIGEAFNAPVLDHKTGKPIKD